jgi:imidazolonepropionase-like amidohydrolase
VDVLAHAIEDTRGLTVDHLRRMKAQNMALVPTLTLFIGSDDRNNPGVVTEVGDYARLGGQILFGTDVGYLPDYGTSREYELMARAGLAWREILAALTTNPAERFGAAARRGRLRKGMDGDLVVLGADPARDVRAFADVRHTIRGGQVVFTSRP